MKNLKLLLGLQFSLISAKLDLPVLTAFFKGWVSRKEMETAISQILKTRFKSLETPYPGAALDIDNDQTFAAMRSQFDHWQGYLEKFSAPL